MKFAVGYQYFPDDSWIDAIIQRKTHISEVYFSWGDFPNGRNSQILGNGKSAWQVMEKHAEDLQKLTQAGIPQDLLFNAMCYGKDSLARSFYQKIGDTVDDLKARYLLKTVTTTSPVIAAFLKRNFPDLDIRASVNMGIGTVEGLEYVAENFDSFYMKREDNRNFAKIRQLKAWCDNHGKTLYALANSGCLNYCSAHVFHDNLVAHESEIARMDNGFAFEGICHRYLKERRNMYTLLERTGFVRPEDVALYEGLFPAMKLATRVNANPVKIVTAYIDRCAHIGSILDLLEPNHSRTIYPYILENSRIEAEVTQDELKYVRIEKALIQMEDAYADE